MNEVKRERERERGRERGGQEEEQEQNGASCHAIFKLFYDLCAILEQ